MKLNVGIGDASVRVVIGIILLVAVLVIHSPARWIGLIGVLPLFTGIVNWCPLYSLLGLSTRAADDSPAR